MPSPLPFSRLPVGRFRCRRRIRRNLLLDGIEPVIDLAEIADDGVVATDRSENESYFVRVTSSELRKVCLARGVAR
jgi:hypothetical protein